MALAAARHILVNTEAVATKLKQRLAQGDDFAMLAKKHSLCPSKKKGGDLGEVKPKQMVAAVDNVIFNKKVLEVHGPVKTKFGYHLIQVIYRN